MATHSSVFTWRIPGMGEPGGLPSMGSQRVRHEGSDLVAAICCPVSSSKPYIIPSVQFSSFTQSCPTFCDPMDCSTPGFPVHHQLPELAQTHVHRVGDATQPSHLPLSSSLPAFNLSQHQGLSNKSVLHIRWPNIGVSASTSVLPMRIQD